MRSPSARYPTDTASPTGTAHPGQPSPLFLSPDVRSLEDALSEFYDSVEGCLQVVEKNLGEFCQLMFGFSLVNVGVLEEGRVDFRVSSSRCGRGKLGYPGLAPNRDSLSDLCRIPSYCSCILLTSSEQSPNNHHHVHEREIRAPVQAIDEVGRLVTR